MARPPSPTALTDAPLTDAPLTDTALTDTALFDTALFDTALFDTVLARPEPAHVAASADRVPTGQLVIAATDGSSIRNPGPAAWCWYIGPTSWAAGTFAESTNNIAELTAIGELLAAVPGEVELQIRCDSSYAINALTVWRFGWARKGWLTSAGTPVANVDLIRAIAARLTSRSAPVTFVKVRAHQVTGGDPLNEAADARANEAAHAVAAGGTPATGPGYPG